MNDLQLQLLSSPELRRHLELEAKRRKSSVTPVIREAIAACSGSVRTERRIPAVADNGAMQAGPDTTA